MTAPRARRQVSPEPRILRALAAGETLQQILARPGITDQHLTDLARKYRLRVTSDGELQPISAGDNTRWALLLGEHHSVQAIRTQAARARACLDSVTAALAADRAAAKDRTRRAQETAAIRLWQVTLRGILAEADIAIRALANGDDLDADQPIGVAS